MLRWPYLPLIIALALILTSCSSSANKPAQAGGLPASTATSTSTPTSLITPTATLATIPAVTMEAAGAIPPTSCPVTRPPNPPFIPPSPYPPTPPPLYGNAFWYGTETLWVMLRADATWKKSPYMNGVYVEKTFWWRQGYDPQKDPQPNLLVTGRRLDAPAAPFVTSGATNGSRDDIGSFMIVGVDIPTSGCWEIAGQIAGAELRYVVWLAP